MAYVGETVVRTYIRTGFCISCAPLLLTRTTAVVVRIVPFKVSRQLRKVLNRLEEEEEGKQEALRQRVEEERGKLEATMGFSRAAAVAALAQEVKPRA